MSGGLTAALRGTAAAVRPGTAPRDDGDVPVTVPRDPARRAAEEELSEPAYHQDDPGIFRRILDWVWEQLGRLLGAASEASPGGTVGLVVIVLAVVVLLLTLWLRLGTPRPRRSPDGGTLFDDRPRSAAEHRAAAEAHASASRWSEAVQERMRALVRSLEERALLDPRPGRTADEAAGEAARALPGHDAELRAAAQAFDEVTYAGRPAGEAGYTRLRALDGALERTQPDLAALGTSGASPAARQGGRR